MSNKIHILALGLALVLAALCRLWAAPISAGPDVVQFWAFAKVFQIHGLDFYRYADATAAFFPFKGWGFVYPPIWLLLLGLALLAAPTSIVIHSIADKSWPASMFVRAIVDSGWLLAMKTPIIAADLAIGCLLYWAVPGSRFRKLLFASLWLFHPTSWYESAVFGQFDAIAAAFLLAAIILLERGRDRLAFLLAGLAVMTKQHTLLPIAVMAVILARQVNWRRLGSNLAILAGVVISLSPFCLPAISRPTPTRSFCRGRRRGTRYPWSLPSAAAVPCSPTCTMSSAGKPLHFYRSPYPSCCWAY